MRPALRVAGYRQSADDEGDFKQTPLLLHAVKAITDRGARRPLATLSGLLPLPRTTSNLSIRNSGGVPIFDLGPSVPFVPSFVLSVLVVSNPEATGIRCRNWRTD